MIPDKTLRFRGTKCSGGKQSKKRFTAFICANMDGSEKRPLFVIGKAKSPRCFKDCNKLPVLYASNKKAWITSELFENLLRNWDYELSRNNRKILLVVDNCPAHPKLENLQCIELIFRPANVTSVLQPMDQGVIQCLKTHYRKMLLIKLIETVDQNTELKLNLLEGIMMLNKAWRLVSAETITNCFRHAGFQVDIGFEQENDLPLSEWRLRNPLEENLHDWAEKNNITEFTDCNLNEFVNIDEDLEICEDSDDRTILDSVLNVHIASESAPESEEEGEP